VEKCIRSVHSGIPPLEVLRFMLILQAKAGYVDGTSFAGTAYGVSAYELTMAEAVVQRVIIRNDTPKRLIDRFNEGVPLPPEIHPPSGSDGHVAVHITDYDCGEAGIGLEMNFWKFKWDDVNNCWSAKKGAFLHGTSNSNGTFRRYPDAPGVTAVELLTDGVRGSGMTLLGGLFTVADANRGVVEHALAASLPHDVIAARYHVPPAARQDGGGYGQYSVPYSLCFTFPDDLNPNDYNLNLLELISFEAIQNYGMYFVDGGSHLSLYGQNDFDVATGTHPTWSRFFPVHQPTLAIRNLPWSQGQIVLKPLS
jgi:hypothetical protein